jgi:hypothetical protein
MSLTGPDAVAPGWYDDGSGRQRWWDGAHWAQFAEQATAPAYVQQAAPLPPKELGVAYALMLFSLIGVCGIQHFYLGKIGRGVLWLLTLGLLGVGTIIDLFTLPSQTKTINARRAVGIG